jgi:predicted glutamine amidotransferase
MCTILTADRSIPTNQIVDRMVADSSYNSDGFSMLAVLNTGKPFFIKSLDISVLTVLVESLEWTRIFFHARASTQGETSLQNCHGWNSEGTFVFHNGYISAKIARNFDVDSEAIKYWLDHFGTDATLDHLYNENFANVMLVDIDKGEYFIHRSITGSLYTDGHGNYSTNSFDTIKTPVNNWSVSKYDLDVVNTNDETYSDSYYSLLDHDTLKYPEIMGRDISTDITIDETLDDLITWDTWTNKKKIAY